MLATLTRPALGQTADLGTLYDARSDKFIPLSLLKVSPPAAAIKKTDINTSDFKVSKSETYREKLKNLSLGAELGASFLASMVAVEGSGSYLTDTRDSNRVMETSLHCNIATVHERLNFDSSGLMEYLALENLDKTHATHIVAEISWGAQSIVTARYTLSKGEDQKKVEGRFKSAFEKIPEIGGSGGASADIGKTKNRLEDNFQVTVHGDVLADDGLVPTDLASAYQFISNVPKYIKNANDGKGKALTYKLLPIDVLGYIYDLEITVDTKIRQLSAECLEKFVDLFDDIAMSSRH